MHASKLPKSSPAPFVSKAKTQGREQPKSAGCLSLLMMKSFGQTSDRVLQAARLKAQQQSKGTEGEKASGDPASAFQGGGHALPPALMAKYEGLLGENVTLEHVRLHQGAGVDAALAEAGLQGLTDGKNVAVSSQAERGTLEHEIGHVAQQQTKGFNLNEGTCGGYERDADGIAEKLVSDRPIEGFNAEAKLTSSPVQTGTDALQAKCEKCEGEERLMKKESSSELKQKQQENELVSPMEDLAADFSESNFRKQVAVPGGGGGPDCATILGELLSFLFGRLTHNVGGTTFTGRNISKGLPERMTALKKDPHSLYQNHRETSQAHPEYGSWKGHQKKFREQQGGLRKRINDWITNNCRNQGGIPVAVDNVLKTAHYWSSVPIPNQPDQVSSWSFTFELPSLIPEHIMEIAAVHSITVAQLWKLFWGVVVKRFAIQGMTAGTLAAADGPIPIGDLIAIGIGVTVIWQIFSLWDDLWGGVLQEF